MTGSGLRIIKAGWDAPSDFRCRKTEFAEYISVSAQYDRQQRMGRMYWAVRGDDVVGYMVLSMGSASMERQEDLGIDSYGPVPSLTIAYLATDKRYERQGVGSLMVSYAIMLARRMAADVGCRVVLADSEPDVVEFYEKMGFVKFGIGPFSRSRKLWHRLRGCMGAKQRKDMDHVPMYFDIGPEVP